MARVDPVCKLRLLKEFRGAHSFENLRQQLSALPDFAEMELEKSGESGAFATVPARNQRQQDRLKALVKDSVAGWKLIEETSYSMPTTF
ncbi:MAG: hypothetical protein RL367_1114 [Pseudomonadota bacterium]